MRVVPCWMMIIAGLTVYSIGCSRGTHEGQSDELSGFGPLPPPDITPDCIPSAEFAIAPPSFPAFLHVEPGMPATVVLSIARNGFCGPVELIGIEEAPSGISIHAEPALYPDSTLEIVVTTDTFGTDAVERVRLTTWMGFERSVFFHVRRGSGTPDDWSDGTRWFRGSEFASDAELLEPGRILVTGWQRTALVGGTPEVRCVEIGGDLCPDYGIAGKVEFPIGPDTWGGAEVEVLPDGRHLVALGHRRVEGDSSVSWTEVFRLHRDGTIDPTYAPTRFEDGIRDFVIDPSGRALLLLYGELFRLHPDGGVELRFVPAVPDGIVAVNASGDFFLAAGSQIYGYHADSVEPYLTIDRSTGLSEVYARVVALSIAEDGTFVVGLRRGHHLDDSLVEVFQPDGSLTESWLLGRDLDIPSVAKLSDGSFVAIVTGPFPGLAALRSMEEPVWRDLPHGGAYLSGVTPVVVGIGPIPHEMHVTLVE